MLDGHVELELPAEPSSPQIAREAIAGLGALSPDLLDRAQLITSELVTNGVRHGNSKAGAHIQLSAELHPNFLRIEVTSPAAPSRPTIRVIQAPMVQNKPRRSNSAGILRVNRFRFHAINPASGGTNSP